MERNTTSLKASILAEGHARRGTDPTLDIETLRAGADPDERAAIDREAERQGVRRAA